MMSNTLAIIGGTGLTTLKNLEITKREVVQTPYGEPSAPLAHGIVNGKEVLFLPRHGYGHVLPPHKINYRANIWALKQAGASHVLAVAAVGGIRHDMQARKLVVPDQIIDYTWSRTTTFFEEGLSHVTHIDFSYPYSNSMRQTLINSCRKLDIDVASRATYAATQGPRLETAAEIKRLEQDGCDIVGMTGMPEAALARELELNYACLAVVANLAAGKTDEDLTMEMIEDNLNSGMEDVRKVIEEVMNSF
ncbi:MAG: S-methyl-5'-thioinosine phosphorylase [Gammaproteobacteria bacterium]|nr:S-methyl-5'-thioinosine phosphorylase [Gammaproteobacteria bacterium]